MKEWKDERNNERESERKKERKRETETEKQQQRQRYWDTETESKLNRNTDRDRDKDWKRNEKMRIKASLWWFFPVVKKRVSLLVITLLSFVFRITQSSYPILIHWEFSSLKRVAVMDNHGFLKMDINRRRCTVQYCLEKSRTIKDPSAFWVLQKNPFSFIPYGLGKLVYFLG